MSKVFDITAEGQIEVRKPGGGVGVVSTPAGFSPASFRTTVAGIYTHFVREGRLPTAEELHKQWPAYPKTTYAKLMLTEELVEALAYRGVQWNDKLGLTLEQQTALMMLSNPLDRRSLATRLKELGIPMPRYQAWLKQPIFASHLNRVTKDAYADHLPMMRQALISNALNNDQKAIEMIFAMTGEWNPAQQSVQDSKAVVLSVIEAVIRHVTDPDTRRAILADVQAAVVSFDVTNPQRSLES